MKEAIEFEEERIAKHICKSDIGIQTITPSSVADKLRRHHTAKMVIVAYLQANLSTKRAKVGRPDAVAVLARYRTQVTR